jgi:hypothetical protein
MPTHNVTANQPISIRRKVGETVTFVNSDPANDAWLSSERSQLAATAPGVTPNGTKLARGGTALQYPAFNGIIWVRSLVDMTIEVLP